MVHGELEFQPRGLVLQEGPSIRDGGEQGKKEVHQAHIPLKPASLRFNRNISMTFTGPTATMKFVSTSQ